MAIGYWGQRTHYDGGPPGVRTTIFNASVEAPRHLFLVTLGYDSAQIALYKAANPAIKVLLYKNSMWSDSANIHAATDPSNGSSIAWDDGGANDVQSNPTWGLKDAGAVQITQSANANMKLTDIGNAALRTQQIANITNEVSSLGFDGVFLDDCNTRVPSSGFSASAQPASYANDAAWQTAIIGMLTGLHSAMSALGQILICNTTAQTNYPSTTSPFQNYLANVDGMMEEGWMRANTSHSGALSDVANTLWPIQIANALYAEAQGKYYICETPSDTTASAEIRYGLASMLMIYSSKATFDIAGTLNYSVEGYKTPEMADALNLGAPSGGYFLSGDAVINQALDPSVESGIGDLTKPATLTAGTGTISADTTRAAYRTQCAKFTPTNVGTTEGFAKPVAGPLEDGGVFKAGKAYKFSVLTKPFASSGGGRAMVVFAGIVGDVAVSAGFTPVDAGDRHEVTWTPSADRATASVGARYTVQTSQPFILDGFLVHDSAVANIPYQDGSFPGCSWFGTAELSRSHVFTGTYYQRNYANGLAVVNPFAATVTVNMATAHTGSGYTAVTSFSLPAQDGAVLLTTRSFASKVWEDSPSTNTPLSAFGMNDLEARQQTFASIVANAYNNPTGTQDEFPDRSGVGASVVTLTTGRLQLTGPFRLRAGVPAVGARFYTGGTASTAITNMWACLVRLVDLAVQAKSADGGATAWGANTARDFTFTLAYTPLVDEDIYIGLVPVGTGLPNWRGIPGAASFFGALPMLAATSTTGLAAPATLGNVAAALVADANLLYAALI